MIFSQTAEYALRAMAHLASLPEGQPVRARDLSEATGIPADYVSKVLRRMVQAELLRSQKGHGGGFRLAQPPGSIRFADVLLAVDERIDPDRCAFGLGACNTESPCRLHNPLSRLKATIANWAENTTFAEVAAVRLPQLGPTTDEG